MWISWIYAACAAWLIVSAFTIAHWEGTFNLWNNLIIGIIIGVTTVILWIKKD